MFRSIKTRVAVAFLAAAIIVIVVFGGIGFFYIYENQHEVTDQNGASAADSCAAVFELAIDEEEESQFVPGTQVYERCRKILRDVCRNSGMAYMYAYRCDVEAGTSTYLMCVAADDKLDEKVARERGYGTVVKAPFSEEELRALQGEVVTDALELNNSYGHTLAWFSLVEGWDGKVLAGADYSVSEQRRRVQQSVVLVVVPFLAVLAVLLLMQLYILRRYVFDLVREIADRMRGFTAGRTSAFEPLGIDSNDEIGDIARAFEGMAADIDSYLDDIERMTAERVQADVELDVARRIQLGMVPELSDAAVGGFEVAAFSRAARTVGGDFYDIIERDDGTIAVVVGDVAGKGVAAALFMAMAKTMIAEGFASGAGPADVLNAANEDLCASNPEGMFATVFACVLDTATGELRYANAGHMPPLVLGPGVRVPAYVAGSPRDEDADPLLPLAEREPRSADEGSQTMLEVGVGAHVLDVDPGVLIGLFEDAGLVEGRIVLAEGEGLLIYSDGVTEAVNADRAFLGEEAFVEHMRAHAPYASAREIVDAVVGKVDDFAGGCEQSDDLTIAALARRPLANEPNESENVSSTHFQDAVPGGEGIAENESKIRSPTHSCELELACEMASLAAVREALFAMPVDDALKRKACLACEEAFTNIVSYSGAQRAWFAASSDGEAVCMTLEDDGIPFDPLAIAPAEKEFEELDGGGMGISLIRQLASDISYRRADDRNILTIRIQG